MVPPILLSAASSIFTGDALDVISCLSADTVEFSGGIARKVNNIDDHVVKVVIANEFLVKPD